MTDLPPQVAEVVARIGLPDAPVDSAPPRSGSGATTGELGLLLDWWLTVAPGPDRPLAVTQVQPPTGGTGNDALASMMAGVSAADRAADAGATLLVPGAPTADPVPARAVIGLLARKEASLVTYQSPGMSDRQWMAECAAVRDAIASVGHLRADPLGLLDALAAPELSFVVGVLIGSAARRTPCLIDGTGVLAAALVADRVAHRARGWWRVGSTSTDPARQTAADRLDLPGGLPLGLADDVGMGAQATIRLLGLVTDDAGP